MVNIELKEYGVYKFDGVFYTREELEELGFQHFDWETLKNRDGDCDFVLFMEGNVEKSLNKEYVFDAPVFDDCFGFDFGYYVKILDAMNYCAVELDEKVFLFCDEEEKQYATDQIKEFCHKVFNSYSVEGGDEYTKQKQLQKKKESLKEMISSK